MRLFPVLFCLLLSTSGFSQTDAIDDFYAFHRKGADNFSINLGRSLLRIGSWFIEEPDTRALVRKSRRARILVAEDDHSITRSEINQLFREIKADGYETLAFVRDGYDQIDIYLREDRGYIRNLLLVIYDQSDFVMASLDCRVTYDELKRLLNKEL